VAIGKRKSRIALENVLPHLAPELVVLFFMEIARNLSLIMQLGIFSIFVGNLGIINDTTSGALINTDISFEPEWASMLSTSRTLISNAPWAVIYPALAFFISVLGFNLFGEGLRNMIQRKDSRMPLVFRKLISFDFNYIWKMVDKRRKIKLATISIILVGSFAALSFANRGDYVMDVNPEPSSLPQEAIIGSQEVDKTVEKITRNMAQLGISPLEEDYVMEYDIGPSFMIEDQRLIIETGEGSIDLEPNSDFTFTTTGSSQDEGFVYDATRTDIFNVSDFGEYENRFVLIDKSFYNDQSINHFIDTIARNVPIKGILLVGGKNESMDGFITDNSNGLSVILISREVAEIIKSAPDSRVFMYSSVKPLEGKGRNVVGILQGTDENIGDEAIVVGMNHNYRMDNGSYLLDFNLELMERLCEQRGNKRSIIFMFLDGTLDDRRHGINHMVQDFPYSPNKVEVYLDLTGLVAREFGSVSFSSAQAPVTRQLAWSMGHHLQDLLEDDGFEIVELETRSVEDEYYFIGSQADNAMFWERGIPTIHLLTNEAGEGSRNIEELGSILLEVINRNNY
jgi:peptide/nickel transport system permease protein